MADKTPYLEKNPREYLGAPLQGWRLRLFVIIFESDTPAGRLFDGVLLCLILFSVAVVMLDSDYDEHRSPFSSWAIGCSRSVPML